MPDAPKVFISYSHDTQAHKDWVLRLAEKLVLSGVDTILDEWDLSLGDDVAVFMEKHVTNVDRVLMICTDLYIEKANAGRGGVGYEKMIVTGELLNRLDSNKFIPVIRNVTGAKKLPTFLGTRLYIDMSGGINDEQVFLRLLREIHSKPARKKPPLGICPFDNEIELPVVTKSNEEKPSLKVADSTVFFAQRFASAFPGARGITWFHSKEGVIRLAKLLEEPLQFESSTPIWWYRDGNSHIDSFKRIGSKAVLLDYQELNIEKVAAVYGKSYWQHFVYIQTEPMEPTGLYDSSEANINDSVNSFGYCHEEYGLYKGIHKVTRAEYDDHAAVIDGQLTSFDNDVELRTRYITPYNLLIAAHGSPINNNNFDEKLDGMMNGILEGNVSLEYLTGI